jgi:hypothetical protein
MPIGSIDLAKDLLKFYLLNRLSTGMIGIKELPMP